ncbi:MAG: YggS family pyridoxal phosphate-dependent enzyme [Gammaproteobacteria bacterium]
MKYTRKNNSKNAEISTEKNISVALAQIRQRISDAEQRFNRDPNSVQLLAVSKTKPVDAIQEAIDAGQVFFAENYLQEAIEKIEHFNNAQLIWHFIGAIQSNKTRDIAQHFQWAHTIDRIKVARRLNEQRPDNLPPLNICLQINISGENSKSGIAPDQLMQLADDCAALANIKIRGLMAMPAQDSDFERQRIPFRELKQLFTECQSRHPGLDTLSMGTTNDLEAAIAEGATMVRIGTAIFGARNYQ